MDMLRIGWDSAIGYCGQLAGKMGFKPDIIVGISRGGLVPARILSDMLDVKQVQVLGIRFYKRIGEREESPELTQDITMDIEGRKVLIVDDVADSGRSLAFAKEHLKGAAEIRTAALHHKPHSIIRPDYFVETTSAWIVYPWEVHEVERELTSA